VISKVCPIPNVAPDARVAFTMDPEAQLSTMRELRDEGLEITGTYHSHPRTSAAPSGLDAQLSAYPEAAHAIISLAHREPETRCYRITEEGTSRILLRRT
jgi:proteasome lid subunit RPN8/RPN11